MSLHLCCLGYQALLDALNPGLADQIFQNVAVAGQYVGQLEVPRNMPLARLAIWMTRAAGLPDESPLDVFEEVRYDNPMMVDPVPLDRGLTLATQQMENGDIICYNPQLSPVRPTDSEFCSGC